MQFWRTGRPVAPSVEERFWSKVDKTGDCWEWTAHKTANGYGRYAVYSDGGKVAHMAHRYAYTQMVALIPVGMEIDHTCHNRGCVKPDHLRLATPKQNKENRLGAQSNSSSGVRGVLWNKRLGKWQAQVRHNKQAYYLGLFSDLAEAEAVVTAKRVELFSHNDQDRSD